MFQIFRIYFTDTGEIRKAQWKWIIFLAAVIFCLFTRTQTGKKKQQPPKCLYNKDQVQSIYTANNFTILISIFVNTSHIIFKLLRVTNNLINGNLSPQGCWLYFRERESWVCKAIKYCVYIHCTSEKDKDSWNVPFHTFKNMTSWPISYINYMVYKY